MGIFDFFKKKADVNTLNKTSTVTETNNGKSSDAIPESEKQFYRSDDYYTEKAHEGTGFEQTVITFEERKKTCVPSNTGLYVAEILLLEYCSYGTYPAPKNGYPGFWWFAYGIRNVGEVLRSLEERGYIKYGCIAKSLKGLTVSELKTLLSNHGLSVTGKKEELIERVGLNISEADIISFGVLPKYELTELGQSELDENEYVPYMHKNPHKTNDVGGIEHAFNVWSINRLLGDDNKSNWKNVVDREEVRVLGKMQKDHEVFMERLSTFDPSLRNEMENQDKQFEMIQQTEIQLEGNANALIEFWENIWNNGGLLFEGSRWIFRLPDLYIKVQSYDKAIAFCEMLKKQKPNYADKAESYITKIETKKNK